MKKSGILIAGLGVTAMSQANFNVNSVSGELLIDGSAYGGGNLEAGQNIRLNSMAGNSMSSLGFSPVNTNQGNYDQQRWMFKTTAGGSGGTWNLPSDRDGGVSSATSGDSRIFNTWNSYYWFNSHSFTMNVDNDGTDDSWIDMEIQYAPTPTFQRAGGTFTHDWLDNGIYDQDPTVGNVVINKDLTPTINMGFGVYSYDFTRDLVHWNDGSTSESMNTDAATNGVWFNLGNASSFYIFSSGFNSDTETWAVGEGVTTKNVGEFSGTMVANISGVALGSYTASYWAIPWHTYGYDADLGGLSVGAVDDSHQEINIQIVPEPTSMVALGLGAAVLLRRRRK